MLNLLLIQFVQNFTPLWIVSQCLILSFKFQHLTRSLNAREQREKEKSICNNIYIIGNVPSITRPDIFSFNVNTHDSWVYSHSFFSLYYIPPQVKMILTFCHKSRIYNLYEKIFINRIWILRIYFIYSKRIISSREDISIFIWLKSS